MSNQGRRTEERGRTAVDEADAEGAGRSAGPRAPRLNVGRIDHIVLAYHDRASQARARDEFSRLLGVDDWEDLGELEDVKLAIWISWQAGLELICPTGPGSFADEHLARHGEGFFSMVFGVEDLPAAMKRVEESGGNAIPLEATPPAGAVRRYAVTREAIVGEIGAIPVLLGEFSLRRPTGSG
jgi:4-hydroxyphenylpyruvate dioxygenase-like putative hemolysin